MIYSSLDKMSEVIETLDQLRWLLESYYMEEFEDFAGNVLYNDVIQPLEFIREEIEDFWENQADADGAI